MMSKILAVMCLSALGSAIPIMTGDQVMVESRSASHHHSAHPSKEGKHLSHGKSYPHHSSQYDHHSYHDRHKPHRFHSKSYHKKPSSWKQPSIKHMQNFPSTWAMPLQQPPSANPQFNDHYASGITTFQHHQQYSSQMYNHHNNKNYYHFSSYQPQNYKPYHHQKYPYYHHYPQRFIPVALPTKEEEKTTDMAATPATVTAPTYDNVPEPSVIGFLPLYHPASLPGYPISGPFLQLNVEQLMKKEDEEEEESSEKMPQDKEEEDEKEEDKDKEEKEEEDEEEEESSTKMPQDDETTAKEVKEVMADEEIIESDDESVQDGFVPVGSDSQEEGYIIL